MDRRARCGCAGGRGHRLSRRAGRGHRTVRSVAAAAAGAPGQLAHRPRRRLLRKGLLDLLEVAERCVRSARPAACALPGRCTAIGCPGSGDRSATRGRRLPWPASRSSRTSAPDRWVVARAGHQLRAEEVGLLLVLAAVFSSQRAEAELAALAHRRADAPANHRAGDGAGEVRRAARSGPWSRWPCRGAAARATARGPSRQPPGPRSSPRPPSRDSRTSARRAARTR